MNLITQTGAAPTMSNPRSCERVKHNTYEARDSGEVGGTQKLLVREVQRKRSPACDVEAHVGELDAVGIGCHTELVWAIDSHRCYLLWGNRLSKILSAQPGGTCNVRRFQDN